MLKEVIDPQDNFDINAGTILGGEETIEDVGNRIFDELLKVVLGHKEFAVSRIRGHAYQIYSKGAMCLEQTSQK